jgi:hypothetical protein
LPLPPAARLTLSRGRLLRSLTPSLIFFGLAIPLILLLAWPVLFTEATINGDWVQHFWFIYHQSLSIRSGHAPSLFLNYENGVFYPLYAFYGGTLYALAGIVSLLLGNAPLQAYSLGYVADFAAAYGGWYWISRSAGLGRWSAHIPGLLFITSPYYLTDIYGRGDWAEFSAVSMIPLVVASGLSVLRDDRVRVWPALALAISSIVFMGSHNITLLWGSTVLALIAVLILVLVPQARSQVSRAGLIRVACLVIPALMVDMWFLLPAIVYQSQTAISGEYAFWQEVLKRTLPLVSAAHLFTISRASDSPEGPNFALSLPIVVMAWALMSIAVMVMMRSWMWLRVMLILSAIAALLGVVMTHPALIGDLPRPYTLVQFSYRLETYVLLGISGAVLAVLVGVQKGKGELRVWTWTIIPVLLVSLVGAIQQAAAYPEKAYAKYPPRSALIKDYIKSPLPGNKLTDYVDVNHPHISAAGLPKLEFPPAAVHNDHVSVAVSQSPGTLVDTNLESDATFVNLKGATFAGVDETGYSVLRVGGGTPAAGSTQTISISPANGPPVVIGRLLALLGIAALIMQLVVLPIRRSLRSRRAG